MFVYECVHVCNACVSVCIYMYACVCVSGWVHVCVSECVCVCRATCVYVYTCLWFDSHGLRRHRD